MGFMGEAWENLAVDGRGSSSLKETLKGLKSRLKEWNQSYFENVHKNIAIEKALNELDKKGENVNHVGFDDVEKNLLYNECHHQKGGECESCMF